MGRLLVEHTVVFNKVDYGSVAEAIALFLSVSVLIALCAKHSRRRTQKPDPQTTNFNCNSNISPLASPMKMVAKVNNLKKRLDDNGGYDQAQEAEIGGKEVEEEGGLWQKSILMGEKCRPPEFSGVIYYDSRGNQLPEMPRSPRASPLPSISFPAVKDM